MFTYFHSVILGIVEGITEFLPISSTAHLMLSSRLLNIPVTEFLKTFEIAIQLGAILSVIALYWKDLFKIETIKRLIIAFIPTAIIGLAMYKAVKSFLGNDMLAIWMLLLGGIVIIIFEKYFHAQEQETETLSQLSYKQCLLIGLFQSIAIVPGVSRSAATIIGGRVSGISKKLIVEFSFLLAVPTMAAATGLDLLKSYKNIHSSEFGLLAVGFVVSFIVAMLAIKFLLGYIRKRDFSGFGWYRILFAILMMLMLR